MGFLRVLWFPPASKHVYISLSSQYPWPRYWLKCGVDPQVLRCCCLPFLKDGLNAETKLHCTLYMWPIKCLYLYFCLQPFRLIMNLWCKLAFKEESDNKRHERSQSKNMEGRVRQSCFLRSLTPGFHLTASLCVWPVLHRPLTPAGCIQAVFQSAAQPESWSHETTRFRGNYRIKCDRGFWKPLIGSLQVWLCT